MKDKDFDDGVAFVFYPLKKLLHFINRSWTLEFLGGILAGVILVIMGITAILVWGFAIIMFISSIT